MLVQVLADNPHTVLIWNDEISRAVGELRSRYEVRTVGVEWAIQYFVFSMFSDRRPIECRRHLFSPFKPGVAYFLPSSGSIPKSVRHGKIKTRTHAAPVNAHSVRQI